MALTPDDLLTKRFEETRFRDGYDQEEVDEFLDEIAAQWRELLAERDRLAAEVEQVKAGAPAEGAAPAAAAAPAESEAEQAAVVDAGAAPKGDFSPSADSSASLLAMAQRLHDEHVLAGETRRDELIAEAESKRDELIAEAESKRDELITTAKSNAEKIDTDAQNRKQQLADEFEITKGELEQERADLQEKIDELKSFERDYRLRLRGYIESQLRDLDRASSLGTVSADDDASDNS